MGSGAFGFGGRGVEGWSRSIHARFPSSQADVLHALQPSRTSTYVRSCHPPRVGMRIQAMGREGIRSLNKMCVERSDTRVACGTLSKKMAWICLATPSRMCPSGPVVVDGKVRGVQRHPEDGTRELAPRLTWQCKHATAGKHSTRRGIRSTWNPFL